MAATEQDMRERVRLLHSRFRRIATLSRYRGALHWDHDNNDQHDNDNHDDNKHKHDNHHDGSNREALLRLRKRRCKLYLHNCPNRIDVPRICRRAGLRADSSI